MKAGDGAQEDGRQASGEVEDESEDGSVASVEIIAADQGRGNSSSSSASRSSSAIRASPEREDTAALS